MRSACAHLLVAALISGDQAAQLGKGLVTVLQRVARGVAVGDLRTSHHGTAPGTSQFCITTTACPWALPGMTLVNGAGTQQGAQAC
jgi:hypothetical protein